jgi:hypothetical protein
VQPSARQLLNSVKYFRLRLPPLALEMFVLTTRAFAPLSVLIVSVLSNSPLVLPATFMVTPNYPCVPGTSTQGSGSTFAAVQPHEALTLLMVTSPGDTFVRLKLK